MFLETVGVHLMSFTRRSRPTKPGTNAVSVMLHHWTMTMIWKLQDTNWRRKKSTNKNKKERENYNLVIEKPHPSTLYPRGRRRRKRQRKKKERVM